jgi:DnaJ-class molecular chaperone
VLGVACDASPAHIAAAYRALIRVLHPDAQDEPANPVRLAEVLAAYALLRDPHSRAAYDRQHHPATAPRPSGADRTQIPVRVHPGRPRRQPDIRVGPVRRHHN